MKRILITMLFAVFSLMAFAQKTASATISFGVTANDGATVTNITFSKLSGPTGGTVVTPNPVITPNVSTLIKDMVEGVYVFQISATDSHGLNALGTMKVTVLPAWSNAPTISAGPDQIIRIPN